MNMLRVKPEPRAPVAPEESESGTGGAKRPKIEGEAPMAYIERVEGSGEGARWAPLRKIVENSHLKTVQSDWSEIYKY